MLSQMMDVPLQIKSLLWRAERLYGHKEIITRTESGFRHRTYAEFGLRVRRLANALRTLGVQPGDRVATLAWNTDRHLEAYFAVPCMGAVLHTINLRLPAEQIGYIIEHADDEVLLVSSDMLPVLEGLRDHLGRVRAILVLSDDDPPETTLTMPVVGYETALAAESEEYDFPDLDENTAAGMCYTSGTTGNPKGVVYSHRSHTLHALTLGTTGSIGVDEHERYMLVTPMSHVNSWGMPYGCVLYGATIVLPGDHPVGVDYLETIEHGRPSFFAGAVTVGMLVRETLQRSDRAWDVSSLKTLWLGGQAPPVSEMRWWKQNHGIDVVQAWGMTEASPLLTFCGLASQYDDVPAEDAYEVLGKQGQPLPMVEISLVDDEGVEQPWDGVHPGEVRVRSPWVASAYYDDARSAETFRDGWFYSGDIGYMTPDGYLVLVDRAKDLIKSGGEWISSVDLENHLMAHPAVKEAAVVAAPDPKWVERPVAFVVSQAAVTTAELAAHLRAKFPSFWVPDRFEFIDDVPKTGVGKFDKKLLRRDYV